MHRADDDRGSAQLAGHAAFRALFLSFVPRWRLVAFTLQAVPVREPGAKPFLASNAGFSLHAGVAVRGGDRKTLERLCRYITWPALAEGRLSLTPQGRVRYTLKTPYRDGTTHVIFEPLDFIARLTALVPTPRMHLTRYHGVFAPHSAWRARIMPAGRGSGVKVVDVRTPAERRRAMTWAQRLKRVFQGPDRARIGRITLVAAHKGLHHPRRQQLHLVPELLQLARPVLRTAAGLHADQARPTVREVLQELRPLQLHTDHLAALELDPVQLKHPLCDSDADHGTLHLGPSGCL